MLPLCDLLSHHPFMQVNVVVMRGVNDDEMGDFVELTRHKAINVRFIEYMPFDGNVWAEPKMVTYRQMLDAVQQRFPDGLQRMQVKQQLTHMLLHVQSFLQGQTYLWCVLLVHMLSVGHAQCLCMLSDQQAGGKDNTLQLI